MICSVCEVGDKQYSVIRISVTVNEEAVYRHQQVLLCKICYGHFRADNIKYTGKKIFEPHKKKEETPA